MTHFAIDARNWLVGPVDDDTPGSVPIEPPAVEATDPSPGQPWPLWCRFEWQVQPYAPVPVPDQVERWRAHYVLTAHGYMDAVLAAIDGITDPAQRNLARAEFTQRPYIHRTSYWTQMLQQAAGISDAERDQMFIEAEAL